MLLDDGCGKADVSGQNAVELLLVTVFFFVFFVVFFLEQVAVLAGLALILFFFVVVVKILGDDVEVNRMGLRDFEFRFALGATEDLAFFHFVFVDVDFGGTLGAANHGFILRRNGCR
jgi:hypothetical protein